MARPSRQSAEFEAAALEFASATPKRRALVVVNPYATTVSDRLRSLVVHALSARYEVEAIDTQERGHATEICREGAWEGYDVVIAFGGDGTVNEVINGLAGSPTPLTCLPGGRTNVFCKLLGIPGEIVDATEHLLAMADAWRPRLVDLGVVNDRCFAFSSGVGLDASVVRRVDAHPGLKARARRELLRVRGAEHLRRSLPPAAAAAGRTGRRHRRTRSDGSHPERRALHVLQRQAGRRRRRHRAWTPVNSPASCSSRANLIDAPSILMRMLARALGADRPSQDPSSSACSPSSTSAAPTAGRFPSTSTATTSAMCLKPDTRSAHARLRVVA